MNRIKKVREFLKEKSTDGVFISSYENRRYLSGFTGSNGFLILTQQDLVLITDQRYTEQAENQAAGFKIITHGLNAFNTIKEAVQALNVKSLGFETKKITDFEIRNIKSLLPDITWTPFEDFVIKNRSIKDSEEIKYIKTAVQIADYAMLKLAKKIKAGMTEREIALELEYLLAKEGSEGPAFGTIVASGKRSSLPHGTPSDKAIEIGEMVVIDYGASYKGYMSDITRTLWIGEQDRRMINIFDIVLKAQEAAIKAIRPGMSCGDIDKAHREVFIENNLEQYSLRGLGHGVGLEIHEYPRVVMNNDEKIEEGMIFTVEPGIYIPDFGGVRTEDVVLVTSNGCEVLTKCPKIIHID